MHTRCIFERQKENALHCWLPDSVSFVSDDNFSTRSQIKCKQSHAQTTFCAYTIFFLCLATIFGMVSFTNIFHHDFHFQLAIVAVAVVFVQATALCSHFLFVCAPVIYRWDQTNASQFCEMVAMVVSTSRCTSHMSKNAYTSQRNTEHTHVLFTRQLSK